MEKKKTKKAVGTLNIQNPTTNLKEIIYLKDGKLLTTIHDGSFSPFEPTPTPYTPDPWLRLTGGEDGGTFYLTSDVDLHLETSIDLSTWSDLTMTYNSEAEEYATDDVTINEGDVLYIRASQSNTIATYFSIDCFEGFICADGNAYALFGKEPSDWVTIRRTSFTGMFMHIPDLPATTPAVVKDDYSLLEGIISETFCPVSDDGVNLNFHIGVTPAELYEAEYISADSVFQQAAFLGNTQGFNTWLFFTRTIDKFGHYIIKSLTITQDVISETNGEIYENMILFDDIETASATLAGGSTNWHYKEPGSVTMMVVSSATLSDYPAGTEFYKEIGD